MTQTYDEVQTFAERIRALAAPSRLIGRVGAKVQSVSKNRDRGLVVAYIDARLVQDTLDETFGPDLWETEVPQEPTPILEPDSSGVVRIAGFMARVRLTLRFGEEKVSREDVGWTALAERTDRGTAIKGCVSDGFKRCGVQFGIGRPLYDLTTEWIGLDSRGQPLPADLERVLLAWDSALRDPPSATVRPLEAADSPATGHETPQDAPPSSGGGVAPPPPGSGSEGGIRLVTDAQMKLIGKLLSEKDGAEDLVRNTLDALGLTSKKELPRAAASKLIDEMMNNLPAADPGVSEAEADY